MNNTEIIQALQQNEKPFGLMSEEMQAKAKEIDRKKFYRWAQAGSTGAWCVDNLNIVNFPNHCTTYRLRNDYEEKADIVECEIYTEVAVHGIHDILMFKRKGDKGSYLNEAPDYPDFIGFRYKDERMKGRNWHDVYPVPRIYIGPAGDIRTSFDFIDIALYKVLTPVAVLFRSTK